VFRKQKHLPAKAAAFFRRHIDPPTEPEFDALAIHEKPHLGFAKFVARLPD
jgi:hypothetical protein